MRALLTTLTLIGCLLTGFAQQRIDGTFAFQTDPAKKYSIYIPTGYNVNTPHRLMVALHPFNTNRWDAQSWCDTLINFAAMNNLILACPDGGADGQVDDPIDTAFTTALIDSMHAWYNIDAQKIYCMGFSWGGMITYSYGLNHINRFGGFLPIGSAMNGTGTVNSVLSLASGKPWYIVHGSSDSPSSRFFPIRDSIVANGGIANWNYMTGVGHTIDFPNRNQILSVGFQWIDSVNCAGPVSVKTNTQTPFEVTAASTVNERSRFEVSISMKDQGSIEIQLIDLTGKIVVNKLFELTQGKHQVSIALPNNTRSGIYVLSGKSNGFEQASKMLIR